MSSSNYWSTTDMEKGGTPYWLLRLYEKTVNGIRQVGLPSTENATYLSITVPSLIEQARQMRQDVDSGLD